MTIEEFEKIINKIKNYTKLVCLHVKGEPLLHPQLEEILWIIDKYNLKTNITTNGTLLNERINIINSSNSVRQLNISLHSVLENENINILKYLDNVFKSVEILNGNNIIISYRLWNLKDITVNEKNKIVIDKLGEVYRIDNLLKKLKQNEWIKLDNKTFVNQDTSFTWPNLNSSIINDHGRCLALKNQIAILVNGDVIPCCIDSEGEMVLGNIFEQSLENILESKRARKIKFGFQNNNITEETCARCGFLNRLENKRKKL